MVASSEGLDSRGSSGWPKIDNSEEMRSSEAFDRLDELWDMKWQGDAVSPTVELNHSLRPAYSWNPHVTIGVYDAHSHSRRRSLDVSNGSTSLKRSASYPALRTKSTHRGLLKRVKTWLQHVNDKRRGIVYTSTGPCQLFSDWGIPPYPEDYDWDQ